MTMTAHPALVLNADFRPMSCFLLSLLSWQDAISAVFSQRVSVVALRKYQRPRGALRSRASTCSCATASPASTAARCLHHRR
jgi:hypothetical protein